MLPTRDPLQNSNNKKPTQTECEGLEKNIPSKWTGKRKAWVAIPVSQRIDFKTNVIKRDTESHFIILK